MLPLEGPQDRTGTGWTLLTHANRSSRQSSCSGLELQNGSRHNDVESCRPVGRRNFHCISPSKRPSKSQYIAPYPQHASTTTPSSSSRWTRGASISSVPSTEPPTGPGDTVELLRSGGDRVFSYVQFHGAAEANAEAASHRNTQVWKSKRRELRFVNEMAQKDRQGEDGPTQAEAHQEAPVKQRDLSFISCPCGPRCSETIHVRSLYL